MFIDLAAERAGGEAVAVELIAVEVQSFGTPSPVADLHQAVGQFTVYRILLGTRHPDRTLFLAVPLRVYDGILAEPLGREVIDGAGVPLLVFDPAGREALRWIK